MIGYIISMGPGAILTEVNAHREHHMPHLTDITMMINNNTIFRHRQKMQREYVVPKPFSLEHIWIDLRKAIAHEDI
jgi:hypothetical protein